MFVDIGFFDRVIMIGKLRLFGSRGYLFLIESDSEGNPVRTAYTITAEKTVPATAAPSFGSDVDPIIE
ncbi:hypothetical protein HYALB_00002778 [Hymenoscyphus albidus]|uniref:Uncharacterized protein n=1 Tax=Hymenoscyphus albidus TaxID=595503 RepID=A0A9N9LJ81_9HELO|nr:hypothetical protein HYALB_00002778 [Hymenoscyphus albidus]